MGEQVRRGPVVRPKNIASAMLGSIHEQTTAVSVGMRGALVTGRTLQMALVPVLLEAVGQRWFERGTIALEFRDGVLDQEEIQGVIEAPLAGATDAQVRAWLHRPTGAELARGTVSVGDPNEPPALSAQDPLAHNAPSYDLIGEYVPGTRFPDQTVAVDARSARLWDAALPSLSWFVETSPWGIPIASPAALTTALTAGCTAFRQEHVIDGIAIDGAIEIRNIAGPVFLERQYSVHSGVVGRGRSPRTEYFWYESAMDDERGRRVAEMRMKLRWMPHALRAPAARRTSAPGRRSAWRAAATG